MMNNSVFAAVPHNLVNYTSQLNITVVLLNLVKGCRAVDDPRRPGKLTESSRTLLNSDSVTDHQLGLNLIYF